MPSDSTSPVRLQISPTAAQVRTARLVAVGVARRSGVAAEALDEIRLAVGEACSRGVSLHRVHAPGEMVTVLFGGAGEFVVSVCDLAPADLEPAGTDPLDGLAILDFDADLDADFDADIATDTASDNAPELDSDEALPSGFGLGVIAGLVDDLEITAGPNGRGTVVRMRWPLAARPG